MSDPLTGNMLGEMLHHFEYVHSGTKKNIFVTKIATRGNFEATTVIFEINECLSAKGNLKHKIFS